MALAEHSAVSCRTSTCSAVIAAAYRAAACRARRSKFYLLVEVHEDAEDFEHGTSLDIQVTDGQSAWSQKGLHRPTTQIADWMSVAKQALSEESDRFTFIITPKSKPDILRIRWEYCQELSNFRGRLAGQIDVERAVSDLKVVQSILKTALDNVSSLQASHKQVQQQRDVFRQEAETAQKQVQDYVQQKHQKDADLYIKFAAVLNEKKAKAVEWKQIAEQAQDSVQRASNEGIIADEGTPPRNLGDTYSQSTDPSDDEETDIADQSHKPDTRSALDSHAAAGEEAPSSSAQLAHQQQSLEEQPSVARDTQNDPVENMDMQEGDRMDVDTVPLPAAELDRGIEKQAQVSKQSNHASAVTEGQSTAARPARPKAMTRRRR